MSRPKAENLVPLRLQLSENVSGMKIRNNIPNRPVSH